MTDPTETAAPVTTDRAFSTADLAYINRMTTTGMVLPSVAHEVNNSLQVIAGMVEILGLRGQLPPEVSDKVQKIAVQATKAAGHLRELVAFARRDGVSPKVELKAAVERAISLRRYYLTRGRVVRDVDAPADESLVVRADSQHVVQVLVNLVINAEESVAKHDVRTHPRPAVAARRGRPRRVRRLGAGLRCGDRTARGDAVPDEQAGGCGRAGAGRRQAPRRGGWRHAHDRGDAGGRDGPWPIAARRPEAPRGR